MKKLTGIVCLLALMLTLTACAGAGDWKYEDLPGDYAVWRINSQEIPLVCVDDDGLTAEPVVEGLGCKIWDVEYVREGGEWFLRIYIDKDGAVDISDCEKVSRAMDPILDEADPIPDSYNFEVCSAGCERTLKRPGDFQQFMGCQVLL